MVGSFDGVDVVLYCDKEWAREVISTLSPVQPYLTRISSMLYVWISLSTPASFFSISLYFATHNSVSVQLVRCLASLLLSVPR